MATSPPDKNIQQSSYLIAATSTTAPTTVLNNGNETPALCDIKIICTQKKKKNKHFIYLNFIESQNLSSSNEKPCIEIRNKTDSPLFLLNECISYEYFDEIRNDFQSFIYIYFQSYTVSIYFTDEHIEKKTLIVKHLEYMCKQNSNQPTEIINQPAPSEIPCLTTTTENILHTFDIKLSPYETIITRDHPLIGSARLYFTTTDLYIASRDCNRIDLKTTIINQCPSKDKNILCIPYFTIKHYGNRSNIFLIELGKSTYGNGEIHMKCHSSSLASTIHLLVSPVIEERPLVLSSAFQNQLLANRRIEKSRGIQPPIQLHKDPTDPTLPFIKKNSIESLPDQSKKLNMIKSHSVFGFIRKLVKNKNTLERSTTFDNNELQPLNISPPLMNKFFELNIDEKRISKDQNSLPLPQIPIVDDSISPVTSSSTLNRQEPANGTYIDMGPTAPKSVQKQEQEEEEIQDEAIVKEPRTTVDVGVNTTITLSPHVHSAIIVGTTCHLIAEERTVLPPIGQRSFTSPASVMQPFKAQLTGQSANNSNIPTTDMVSCTANSSTSCHQTTNPHQSLLLAYSIVTINKNSDQLTYFSDGASIDRRLDSDVSLMSISHQQQPSNIYSFDNILSASSTSSQIFRTLSFPTNNSGDNTSGRHIRTSHGSIIVFDENYSDQSTTTTYLLGPPQTKSIEDNNLPCLSSVDIPTGNLTNIDEEKRSTNDPYALIEPMNLENATSLVSNSIKTSLNNTDKTIHYTDLMLPTNTGDEQQEYDMSDDNNTNPLNDFREERNEQSSTIFYTDIDFHQTQRRDRIAQFAAMSKMKDQMPPFVL